MIVGVKINYYGIFYPSIFIPMIYTPPIYTPISRSYVLTPTPSYQTFSSVYSSWGSSHNTNSTPAYSYLSYSGRYRGGSCDDSNEGSQSASYYLLIFLLYNIVL